MNNEGRYEGKTEVPDSFVPFIGIRAWRVSQNLRSEDRLYSVYKPSIEWPIAKTLEAHCIGPFNTNPKTWMRFVMAENVPTHTPPSAFCTCGIYALNSVVEEDEIVPWQKNNLLGIVFVWGHVLEGERGYRGQYARIAALWRDPDPARSELALRMAEIYQVPTVADLLAELAHQRELQGAS